MLLPVLGLSVNWDRLWFSLCTDSHDTNIVESGIIVTLSSRYHYAPFKVVPYTSGKI